jgi:uncharacterized protein
LFQNTPNYSIKGNLETSRPGDYIVIEFVEDALIAVSACPFTLDGYLPRNIVTNLRFNGGKSTDVLVEIY